MSAAEKLKALDEGLPENEWPNADVVFSLLAALPQIVAVIEAADTLPEFFKTEDGRTHSFVPLLDELERVLS